LLALLLRRFHCPGYTIAMIMIRCWKVVGIHGICHLQGGSCGWRGLYTSHIEARYLALAVHTDSGTIARLAQGRFLHKST
jgi:hypothetical protein